MALLVSCPSCKTRFRARDGAVGRESPCPKCGQAIAITGEHIPDFDVFISYSHVNHHAAEAVCAYLEKQRLRCWIAPRNIRPGDDWAGAIIKGIENSRALVLVYSAHSNQSKQVMREVERAIHKGLAVIPLRIEDVPLSKNMEYFISASHWLDAIHGPTAEHLEKLARTMKSIISQHDELEGEAALSPPEEPAKRGRRKALLAAGVGLAACIGVAGVLMRNGAPETEARPTTQVAPRPLPGPSLTNSLGMRFAYIPAGEFMMGAIDGDPNAQRDEGPRHRVTLTRAFYLGAHEVTMGEYEKLTGSRMPLTPEGNRALDRAYPGDQSRLPVIALTYDQAQEVCEAMNKLPAEVAAGRQYRLPTEAEWEYACRAGTESIFIGSNTLTPEQASFQVGRGKSLRAGRIVPVGSYAPNSWALYDMLGNAREWCSDFKGPYPSQPQVDPKGPSGGRHHVVRGGTAGDEASECRCSSRLEAPHDAPRNYRLRAGIRLVCVPKAMPAIAPATQARGTAE